MIRTNDDFLDFFEHKINSDFEEKTFAAGDIIIKQDSYIKNILLVKSGLLKCSRFDNDGIEFVQEFFSTGEILGEIETIISNSETKTIAEVQAITEVVCYKISLATFQNLIFENTEFNGLLLKMLANKIRYKALRYSFMQTHTLAQNIAEITKSYPNILSVIHKNDLANYFGVTLRSLNRSLKDFAE
ncbi:Crp/Fnr family transcriptional regulator [Soonwooa sp.]|uniref:Crp/Fnr family transcriptional regulator n=1 Tax=Soonwooa sp. TaxID=1938592 RepID=UPI00261A91EB|nr:Crp/Fnr family transcriptional regulator [Soonwooa sp.]